ncbi:MAG TPA: transposase, partial [Shewanella sp.]|nr:transposase [Shewanella sp.]
EWPSRAGLEEKQVLIARSSPKLRLELGISDDAWITAVKEWRRQYSGMSGRWDARCAMKAKYGVKWCRGKQQSQAIHPH